MGIPRSAPADASCLSGSRSDGEHRSPATRRPWRTSSMAGSPATGRAVLVDLHSYPVKALPYERHQDARRPPVCLGVDVDHTPATLVERVAPACSVIGQVVVNEPFAGSYIPLRHFGRDNRVSSVMVELRRDLRQTARSGQWLDMSMLVTFTTACLSP